MGRALATAALVALVLAATASAAIALDFSQLRARPGDRISAFQPAGFKFDRGERTGILVYLITVHQARRFHSAKAGPPPARARRHFLGELRGDARGFGRVTFRVPNVAPGRYTTLVWCKTCGPDNGTHFASRGGDLPDYASAEPDRGILRIRR